MIKQWIALATLLVGTAIQADEPFLPIGHKETTVALPPATSASLKVCVTECQPTKKTVYSSVHKEYCLPHRSLLGLFHDLCDWCGADEESCERCQMRTKNVLVKKIVAGPPVEKCVLKEVPPIAGTTEKITAPVTK